MSKHIYMSVGAKADNGLFLDRNGAVTNMINYRGESNDEDVASFRSKMALNGHVVVDET